MIGIQIPKKSINTWYYNKLRSETHLLWGLSGLNDEVNNKEKDALLQNLMSLIFTWLKRANAYAANKTWRVKKYPEYRNALSPYLSHSPVTDLRYL